MISVNHLAGGNVKQVRAQLGNDIAIKAFREGKLPFPDGAIIAALHWNEVTSDENNKVLASGFPGAGLQSFVAGPSVNVQFMVKDSKKYAATGGWGYADFTNGKPGNEALHKTCSRLPRAGKGSRLRLHPLRALGTKRAEELARAHQGDTEMSLVDRRAVLAAGAALASSAIALGTSRGEHSDVSTGHQSLPP